MSTRAVSGTPARAREWLVTAAVGYYRGIDDLLAADVTWLREAGTPLDLATADAVEAEWNLRHGRADEARRIAWRALAARRKPPGVWGAMIRAVAWETAADTASRERVRPSEWDVELLAGSGRADWVARLRAAGLLPGAGRSRRLADLMRRGGRGALGRSAPR